MIVKNNIFLLITLFCCLNYGQADLYNSSDPMVLLNVDNFYETVLDTPHAWIIEFYASWCGHCQRFADPWRGFAHEVSDWDRFIKVAVVDCSDNENVPICRDYNVTIYPTIRIFDANSTKMDKGIPVKKASSEIIQEKIVDFLRENGNVYLTPYEGLLEDIFIGSSQDVTHAAVILEDDISYLGSFTNLDLSNYRKVYVRSTSSVKSNQFDVSLYKALQRPTVLIISKTFNIKTPNIELTTREEMSAYIAEELKLRNFDFDQPDTETDPSLKTTPAPSPNIPHSTKVKVYMVDIENALSYAFRHEVSLKQNATGEALKALQEFVNALVHYLPAREPVHNFLVSLNDYMKDKTSIDGQNFTLQLEKLKSQDALLPKEQEWKGCMGSTSQYRGYPCGLWTLFHTLTVNAELEAQLNPDYKPLRLIRAIHGYVKYFFGCNYCSQHFQEMYNQDSAEKNVENANESIMWLWQAHNKVNTRLKGDTSEDPKYPKILFPPKYACQRCWNDDNSFNKQKVLQYLMKIYGRKSVSLEDAQPLSGTDNYHYHQKSITAFNTSNMPSPTLFDFVSVFQFLNIIMR